jgi:inhibitor of cysteine peptidase
MTTIGRVGTNQTDASIQMQVWVCRSRPEWRHTVPEITLSQTDTGGTFEIQPGDRIVVQLSETPSTGYVWAVDELDQEVLTVEGSSFSLVPDSRVGSGGTRVLRFRALAAGESPIRLKLWREWSGSNSATDHFSVTIEVRS